MRELASFSKYKTKKGEFWKFQFYSGIDPKTGKRRLTTRRGFKTKKEAQLVAEELEKQVRSGIFQNNDLTYEEVYKEWWVTHVKTIKLSTQSRKNSLFNNHILPRFGKIKLRDITRAYCQEAIDDIFDDLQNHNTTKDVKIQANLVFKYALKQDYIERNPMEHVVVPKKEEDFLAREDERNYWKKDEVRHFLNLVKENYYHYHHYIMFYLLIYTGMRKGELFALEWDDIDLINKTIRINKTLFFKDGKEYIQTTKKASSTRTISISDHDVKLLKKWKLRQKELFLEKGIRKEIQYVLCRDDLRPLRLITPNEVLNSYIDRYNLHKINVHGLRHTHASLLFEAGANIKEVQARLGHKDVQTTMNVYTHVTEYTSQKTADTFQKFMESE